MKTKRIICLLLVFVMISVLLPGRVLAETLEQDTNGVYLIDTYAKLKEFARIVNEGQTDANARLTYDIIADDADWTPICMSYTNVYTGVFDGDGYTITGLTTPADCGNHVGLFGRVGETGIVKNVGLAGGSINGNENAGGIAGQNFGTILNCYNTGVVKGGVAGGIVANNRGTVQNCYNTGDIEGGLYAGGIAGSIYSISGTASIISCRNSGAIEGTAAHVGGIIGDNTANGGNAIITGCFNTGKINITADDAFVGGIAGENKTFQATAKVTGCYNTGAITGKGKSVCVGGIAGSNGATGSGSTAKVTDCYNTAEITGIGANAIVGGIIGEDQASQSTTMEIANCYNVGAITGTDEYARVGAIAGQIFSFGNNSRVSNCFFDEFFSKAENGIGLNKQNTVTVEDVFGLKSIQMTGEYAIANMPFSYANDAENPWLFKANTDEVWYNPHLKGFVYDETADPADWPAKIIRQNSAIQVKATDVHIGKQTKITVNYPADAYTGLTGTSGHPAGLVTINIDNDNVTTLNGENGVLVFYFLIDDSNSLGEHTVKVFFNGDDDPRYINSVAYTTFNVLPAATTLMADHTVLFNELNTENAAKVWYGGSAWRVIGYDSDGVASETDTMTLLASGNMNHAVFDDGSNGSNKYDGSTLKAKVDDIVAGFSAVEKSAISARTLVKGGYDGQNTDCIAGDADLAVQLLWPLSAKEAYSLNETLRRADPKHPDWMSSYWWLRSPGERDTGAFVVNGKGNVGISGVDDLELGVRPAFRIKLQSVLFTSTAEGGKTGEGTLSPVAGYTGSEWKLTVLDADRSGFTASCDSASGDVWTIKYGGAKTGDNEYISAVIVNSSGEVTYYGRLALAQSGDNNTVTVDLSGKMDEGDKLYVFNEQYNGDKKTDYASELKKIKKPTDVTGSTTEIDKIALCFEMIWYDHNGTRIRPGGASISCMLQFSPDGGLTWKPIKTTTGETGHSYSFDVETYDEFDIVVRRAGNDSTGVWHTCLEQLPIEDEDGNSLLYRLIGSDLITVGDVSYWRMEDDDISYTGDYQAYFVLPGKTSQNHLGLYNPKSVFQANAVIVYFEPDPDAYSLNVTLVDPLGNRLQGAEFSLQDANRRLIAKRVTRKNGEALFNWFVVPPGDDGNWGHGITNTSGDRRTVIYTSHVSYYFDETGVPDGYLPTPETEITVTWTKIETYTKRLSLNSWTLSSTSYSCIAGIGDSALPIDASTKTISITATAPIPAIQLVTEGAAANIAGAQASNVYFGTYQQTSDGSGDFNVEPIKWRVLQNADGKLFLLSDKNLDAVKYHNHDESITWEGSEIRYWLNDYFCNKAFTNAELAAIPEVNVVNDDNPYYGTEGGNDTTDKVFLLSLSEVKTEAYGFPNHYYDTEIRQASNTDYAKKRGVSTSSSTGCGDWWLRSPGSNSDYAALVNFDGYVSDSGVIVDYEDDAVRPALNIDLNSVLFTSAAKGGKTGEGALAPVAGYTGSDWKLTLLDDGSDCAVGEGHKNFKAEFVYTDFDPNKWIIEYSGAKTGENEYISAIIKDSTGAVTYYGRLAQAQSGDNNTVTIDLAGKMNESDKLYVFNEQINGDYMTDYASSLQLIKYPTRLSVKVKEADIYAGEDMVITVALHGPTTGLVTVSVNGVDHEVEVRDGGASLTLSDLEPDEYHVVASYAGDDDYSKDQDTTQFRVHLPETVDVKGVAEWKDAGNESERPEKITVRLLANGNNISITQEVSESGSGHWAFNFKSYPSLDAYDTQILYSVAVDDIPNYTTAVEKVGFNSFRIVITYHPPVAYAVTVTAGEDMTKTTSSGAVSQTVSVGSAMTDVVYTANDGYYFPTDYAVAEVNGVTVTRDSFTQITVSGTPTANAAITLTSPTAKTKEKTPAATFTATGADTGTLSNLAAGMKYKIDNDEWQTVSATSVDLTNLAPCTITVYMPGNGTTTVDSDEQTITVTKAATPNLAVTQPAAIGGRGVVETTDVHEWSSNTYDWEDCFVSQDWPQNCTIFIRVKASGTVLASDYQTVTINAFVPTQEPVPSAVFTATGADTGTLSNLASGMKFKIDNGQWQTVGGNSVDITNLAPCTITIYMPGNGTTTIDSDAQTVTVTKSATPTLEATQPAVINGTGSIPTAAEHQKSTDGTDWTDCTGAWENLEANNTYYVRVKATGTVLASDAQSIEIIAFVPAQEQTPEAIFTANGAGTGMLSNVAAGMKYKIDNGEWQSVTGTSVDLTNLSPCTITLYMPGNGTTTIDSEKQTITVTKAATPTLTATQPAVINGTGSIPTATEHQKSTDGTDWKNCSGTWTELAEGTYYVRVKAAGTVLASDAQTIKINAFVPGQEQQPQAIFTATGADTGTLSNVAAGMKYKIDNGEWQTLSGTSVDLTDLAPCTITVYMPGNGTTTIDSDEQTITVTKAATPTLSATQPATINDKGVIPTTTAHEKSVNGTDWEDCDGMWTDLDDGTYYVRVKAAGTAIASDAQEIVIAVARYTVKFVDEDGTELQSTVYACGETPVYNGEEPTKEATAENTYTFAGWTPEIVPVAEDTTYTARYDATVNEYTVTFESNGGSDVPVVKVKYGEPVAEPDAPEKKSFAFAGWFADEGLETPYDFTAKVTSDTKIYAKWTPISYPVFSGENSEWTNGGNKDVVITVKRSDADETCLAHFIGVEIDGNPLEKDVDYTATKGSVVITLKAATLEKLSVGEHTLAVIFDDGRVETKLTIKAAPNNDPVSPQTGENSHIELWIALMIISFCGFSATLVIGKKKWIFNR